MGEQGKLGEEPTGSAQDARERPGELSGDPELPSLLEPSRDDLLALVAQDLRGPAASFRRLLRTLRRAHRATTEAQPGELEEFEREARRLSSLAESLRRWKRLQSGQVQARSRPTDLKELVEMVVARRLPAARACGVEIACELPSPPSTLSADPELLAEVVGRLLDAAIAGTTRGGRVRLALSLAPHRARIVVEDGRVSQAKSARAPGAIALHGIELALWSALVRRLGGDLEVSARGAGQTALIDLPSTGPSQEREPQRAAGPGRARLLVADDDEDAREMLAMVLEDYEVLLAADGREATETAALVRPDLVLMDLYMPRMDGLTALQTLRSDPLTAEVPVILISGRGDDLTRSRSLDLGAVDFLQKPFSARELKARIERTLRLTRRETQLQELARTDPLTGLANLRAFRARLEDEVKRAHRYRTPLACVMVDMDHLKPINDELGHAAGDIAIGAVADVIRNELRETDFGARYGGDEFVMLLPHTSADEARVLAERLCTRLRDSDVEVAGRRLPIAASFGIAALCEESLDDPGEALVRRADTALYAAKRAGRGRVASHDAGDDAALHSP